jgi:hypothetical protein
VQDFRRLYQVQRIAQACLPAEEQGQAVLPGWMRAYAAAAWQDRFFAEQNFTPLQQVRAAGTVSASEPEEMCFSEARRPSGPCLSKLLLCMAATALGGWKGRQDATATLALVYDLTYQLFQVS